MFLFRCNAHHESHVRCGEGGWLALASVWMRPIVVVSQYWPWPPPSPDQTSTRHQAGALLSEGSLEENKHEMD